MPSTKCIYDKDYVLLNLVTKNVLVYNFIYAASGPLHYSLHLHRALCHNAGLCGLTAKCLCNKISAVCKHIQLWFQL